MFLFAFNLYKQINLFTKHIFANKDITTHYYIYGGVLLGAWCPRGAWCPWCLVPGGVLVVSVVSSLVAAIGGVVLGGWCPRGAWCLVSSVVAPW